MKHTFIYMLLLACTLTGMQCTKQEIAVPGTEETDDTDYTSYWYYTYEMLETIGHETMGLAEANDFNPYTVAQRGDTLFVANIGNASSSLILFSKKSNKPFRTVKTWTFNQQEKSFGSPIEAIVPTADRLYVAERQSRIHVFSLPDMDYVSCIGNGSWGGPVFQAQAMTVKDEMVFARDKDGKVSIYKESDVTPANYQKINRYKKAAPNEGNASNNAFATHYMEVDKNGHIMLTAYEAQTIRVLDPSLVTDAMKNDTSIDIKESTWELPFKPKTFAMCTERMYATGSNDAINIYDFENKAWIKALKTVKGFAFSIPTRIFAQDDNTLWVSDTNKKLLVKTGVFKGEIREYETVSKHLIKVKEAVTRNGATTEEFYVDLRTHEIIDSKEAE